MSDPQPRLREMYLLRDPQGGVHAVFYELKHAEYYLDVRENSPGPPGPKLTLELTHDLTLQSPA